MGLFRSLRNTLKRASHYVGADAWEKLFGTQSSALNRALGKDEALTLSAFWRGVNLLANTIAMLPLKTYTKLPGGGKEENLNHPLYWVLRYKPNELQDKFQFLRMVVVHLIFYGNFYGQIIRNGRLDIAEIYPLNPDWVSTAWSNPGDEKSLVYRVSLPSGKQYELPKEKVFHLSALHVAGVAGLSLTKLASTSVSIGVAQEEHTAAYFARGTRAAGIISHPKNLSEKGASNISKTFAQNYSGNDNTYKNILLEEGMTWTKMTSDAEQSQLLQCREMTISDFARWLGVPPHLLYDLRRATFSNIEQQNLEFYQNSIAHWLALIESAIERQLLRESEWGKTVVEFLVDGILRSDIDTRYKAFNTGRMGGWLCVDEIRAKENMNPLPDGKGKIFLEPLNMKEVGTEAAEDEVDDEDENEDAPADKDEGAERAWSRIFENRIARALRREETMRERGKFEPDKMAEYVESDFRGDLGAYLLYRAVNEEHFDIDAATDAILKRFSKRWVATSENQGDNQGGGKVKPIVDRKGTEVSRLFFLVDAETRWRGEYEKSN